MADILKIDNTKRESYARCPRKFYWDHVAGYTPIFGSTALRYGIVWHAAMEAYYGYIAAHGWTKDGKAMEAAVSAARSAWEKESENRSYYEDYRTLSNLLQSLLEFINHFYQDEGFIEVEDVERTFKILITPTKEEMVWFPGTKPFYFTGKIDMRLYWDGRRWHADHKTTGQNLDMQAERLRRSPQFIGYSFADSLIYDEPSEGSLVYLHHLSAYKSRKTGEYGNPKILFKRSPEIYTKGDYAEWRTSMMMTAWRIQFSFLSDIWPMELNSCYTYGKCTYTRLCEQNRPLGEENPDSFTTKPLWDVTGGVPKEDIAYAEC